MFGQLKARARRSGTLLGAVRATYPAIGWISNRRAVYTRVAPYLAGMEFDEVRLGGRGNEPETHMRRTAAMRDVRGSDVIVLGVGRGEELALWEAQDPRSLTAVEYLDHGAAWLGRDAQTAFARADVRALPFGDASFDVVASTAVLEHVADVDAAMGEMARILRPGGIVFANFGPLFHTYGGAHYEGAYEHLWLDDAAFERYLAARGIRGEVEDGLLWLRNGMFSRLRYEEYLAIFRRHFDVEHAALAVSRAALRHKREHRAEWAALRARFSESDLTTYAMTVWLRSRREASPGARVTPAHAKAAA